jgi:hypothetical protein
VVHFVAGAPQKIPEKKTYHIFVYTKSFETSIGGTFVAVVAVDVDITI